HDNGGTFDLPVIYIEPLLDENKLINVKDEVEIIISNPITIKLSKDSYKLDRKKIADMVEFKKLIIKENGKEKLVVDVLFNDKLIKYLINSISYKIECVPIDAKFVVEGEQVIIEPSIDGKKLIRNEFLSQFEETAHRKESRIFEAPILILKPKLTTEKADSMGIKELVSTDTEYFSSKALNRVHNIRLITSMLDEILIAPHEIFLFNKTTGQRTKEKGFCRISFYQYPIVSIIFKFKILDTPAYCSISPWWISTYIPSMWISFYNFISSQKCRIKYRC
ncbi:unnamed protein product, partial [marine sediment metagenome]